MNENYWKKRQEETIQEILKEADVSADYIAEIYRKSALYTQNKIKGIFDKYRLKHGLSITEAKALLESLGNPHDLDEMLKCLRNGIKSDERKELLKRLEAPAYRYRINRFVDMQHQTDELMKYVYDVEKEISTKSYINAAYNTYYRDVFNIQKDVGVAYRFNNLDSKLVEQMLRSKWSGENYSSRIWGNTQDLTNTLKDEMVLGILTNKTEKEMMDTITEKFSVGAYQARRLIVTESAAISSFADQLAFEDAGIETEMFIAVHDGKTSMVCQKHDRSIVEVGKGEVGRNIPPLHPNCRSKMIPYIEGITDDMKVRQRDPVTGRDEVVKVGETYDQWLKRQQEIHGVDTVDKFRQKVENFSTDKKQYHRYKNVLGKENVPDSLAKFQEMKYNDKEKWKLLKKYKTSRSTGKLSAFSTFEDYRKYRSIIQNEIVGLTTKDGIEIKSQSDHFIERVLGTTEKEGPYKNKKREGVKIEDIISSIINPQSITEKEGAKGRSRKYIGENIEVTLNPDTGNLIQTNPKKRE